MSLTTAYRQVALAQALDTRPDEFGEALASGAMNVEQAQAIVSALAPLRKKVAESIIDRAAVVLAGQASALDPSELRKAGRDVLQKVAPDVAEEIERARIDDG